MDNDLKNSTPVTGKIPLHFTNWWKWNYCKEACNCANSLLTWDFRCRLSWLRKNHYDLNFLKQHTSIGKRGLVTSNFPFSLWTWMKSPTTWLNSSKFVTGRWARWNNRDEDFKDPKLKKGLHEKTRTGASFIPGWLFDFVSHFTAFTLLTGSFYISRLYEDVLHVDKIHVRFKLQTLRMRYPFQSTGRTI